MSRTTTTTKVDSKVERTASGLREGLFQEWDDLREGKSNPQKAMAVAKLAGSIINSVEMETRFHQKNGQAQSGEIQPRTLRLVS